MSETNVDTPVHFHCGNCGFDMDVKSAAAGKRAKCPKCGQIGRVPAPGEPPSQGQDAKAAAPAPDGSPKQEQAGAKTVAAAGGSAKQQPAKVAPRCPFCKETLPDGAAALIAEHALPKPEHTTKCPYCHEAILISARKCKHCGEYLDESLQRMMPGHGHGHGHGGQEPRQDSSEERRWWLPVVGRVATAAVVAVVVGFIMRSGQATVQVAAPAAAAAAGQPVAAAPAAEVDKADASLHALAKALETGKQLQGTTTPDALGNVITFQSSIDGVAKWAAQFHKATDAKQPPTATITLPYSLESKDAKKPSNRGVYVLSLKHAGGQWEIVSVVQTVWATAKSGGGETDISEEDRSSARATDADPAVKHIKKAVLKASAPSGD